MYFTKLRLNGLSPIDLPIIGALPTDIYILKSVDGLGPPEININITDSANAQAYYQGRRPQRREIVALVGLNPDYTVGMTASDLRTSLYGLLAPGIVDSILVEIMNDSTTVVQTTGYVKKLEINPFTKDPEVQITIECLSPYLEAPEDVYLTPGGTKDLPEIENIGEVAVGFHMKISFITVDNFGGWVLTSVASGERISMGTNWLIGHWLELDTRPGYRDVLHGVGAGSFSALSGITSDSVWLTLKPGNNVFDTWTPNFDWVEFFYRPTYWGI